MKNTTKIIIGISLLVLLLVMQGDKKETSIVSRSISPSNVRPFDSFTLTYTSNSGATYITDSIGSGFSLAVADDLVNIQSGTLTTFFMGDSKTITLQAPSSDDTYTFSGTYTDLDENTGGISGNNQIVVQTVISHHYSSCDGNDVYWYNSIDEKEDMKEDCGDDSQDSWGSSFCDGLNIKQERSIYSRGCSGSSCFETPSTERQTIQTCTWKCNSANCQRNTVVDIDNNGVVIVSEIMSYARNLVIGQSGHTVSGIMSGARILINGGEEPVNV